MPTLPLNFDTDLAHQMHGDLQPNTRAWTDLPLTEQLVRLSKYVRAQAARDAQRGRV